ncbi:hypothetical protein [Flavobacterium akiainvivens]|uniref:hypothetical protein n=1 Tax=Flavobacterium akiainvivens TaxID=1202724 RepID=UPI0008E47174|nr:hypothetical protein [Flavobacterium akiainvivens]SFQ50144.1 hypothetical protein SAMN05444144_10649 [Flavobacterium akiainvivens]
MIDDKNKQGKTSAEDNMGNNAEYDKNGNIHRTDDRDRNNSADDWNAELSRTGRHK